jgi:hypothetical protein
MNYNELRSRKDKGPYDSTLEEKISMYDRMPYNWDISLSQYNTLGLISGNIVKYYRYKLVEVIRIIPVKN